MPGEQRSLPQEKISPGGCMIGKRLKRLRRRAGQRQMLGEQNGQREMPGEQRSPLREKRHCVRSLTETLRTSRHASARWRQRRRQRGGQLQMPPPRRARTSGRASAGTAGREGRRPCPSRSPLRHQRQSVLLPWPRPVASRRGEAGRRRGGWLKRRVGRVCGGPGQAAAARSRARSASRAATSWWRTRASWRVSRARWCRWTRARPS